MKTTKKALSVLLAVIMIMSSMSVCFGCEVFAANDTGAIDKFVAAMKCDAMKNFSLTGGDSITTGSGKDQVLTRNYVYTAKSYADYLAVKEVVYRLNLALKGLDNYKNTHTHVSGSPCSDYDARCSNFTILRKYFEAALGDEKTTLENTYNLKKLLDAVLNMTKVSAINGDKNVSVSSAGNTNDSKVQKEVHNTITVKNVSVKQYLLEQSKVADVADEIDSEYVFTMSMHRAAWEKSYVIYTRRYYHLAFVTGEETTPNNAPAVNGTSATNKTALTDMETALTTYSDYLDETTIKGVHDISNVPKTLEDVADALEEKIDAIDTAYGTAAKEIFNHFFGTDIQYDSVDDLVTLIRKASTIAGYKSIADTIKTDYALYANETYKTYTSTQVNALYNELKTAYDNFKAAEDTLEADVADYYEFDDIIGNVWVDTNGNSIVDNEKNKEDTGALPVLLAYYYEIFLGSIKERAYGDSNNGYISEYLSWTVTDIDDDVITSADILTALNEVTLDIDTLNKDATEADIQGYFNMSKDALITELTAVQTYLKELGYYAGLNDQLYAQYATFTNNIATVINADSTKLYTVLSGYEQWHKDLQSFFTTWSTQVGAYKDLLEDDLQATMNAYMVEAYTALKTRVVTQINNAYGLYEAYYKLYKNNVTMASLTAFSNLKKAIEAIEHDAYNWMKSAHWTYGTAIDAESIRKYDALQVIYGQYGTFLANRGLDTYVQTIVDTVREDTYKDIARENTNVDEDPQGEYVVTDAQINAIIDLLEAALKDTEIKALLGGLINKENLDENGNPKPFDLAELINGLIEGIYSDDLINTIISFLYPVVAKAFLDVWVTLPLHVDTEFSGISISADLDLYDVETAIEAAGFALAPGNLANAIEKNATYKTKYAGVISKLRSVKTKTEYDAEGTYIDPWKDSVLFKDKVNAETGEVEIDETTGLPKQVYNLEWGVTDRASFIDAACAALSGLEPLLKALILNQNFVSPNTADPKGGVRGGKIGTNGVNSTAAGLVSLTLDPITLMLDVSACDGYDNVLAPIFEALGLENIPHSEEMTDIRDFLEDGLFAMIDQLVGKLANNPIKTLLDAIPNLVYALEADLVAPLLDFLEIEIYYEADTHYSAGSIPLIAPNGINGNAKAVMKAEKDLDGDGTKEKAPELINVGKMLDLESMGINLSGGLAGILDLVGISLPNLDVSVLATAGKLTWVDSNRSKCAYTYRPTGVAESKVAHIVANRADLLEYLFKWALGNLDSLLALLKIDTSTMGEAVTAIFANLAANADDATAGVVELLNQKVYNTLETYEWYTGAGYVTPTNPNFTPSTQIYMNPGNDWTPEKADYLYNNLEALLASIFGLAKLDLDKTTEAVDGSIEGALDGLVGGLLSDKTLTALAGLLAKLDLNALLAPKDEAVEGEETPDANEPETVAEGEDATEGEATTPAAPAIDVNALIKQFLDIDLSVFTAENSIYATVAAELKDDEKAVHNFGVDAGTSTFAEELVKLLEPLGKVLDFILTGGDLAITFARGTANEKAATLIGYDGYNNAIIPLLEALGCTAPAQGEMNGAAVLEATVNALVGLIDKLTTNTEGNAKDGAIYTIIDLLPGILYFIASDGLTTTVRNLLQPVYVILDTIRPIYDVDLAALIAGIEIGEEGNKKPLGLDLNNLGVETIIDLVANLTGLNLTELKTLIYDVCKYLGVEYTSKSTLQSTWKKGAYILEGDNKFTQADMLTVILSFVLEWAKVPANAAKLDELLKTNGLISSITGALNGIKVNYATPDWMYWFKTEEEFKAYVNGDKALPDTLAALAYPNDWNEETAKYLAENLASLVDMVIALINKDDAEAPKTLSALLTNLLNGFVNDQTMNDLVAMITSLLANIDETLIDTVGVIIDADIAGLKDYNCTAGIDSLEDFAIELGRVLDTYAGRLVQWIFFDDSYEFARTSTNNSTIVLNGGKGYEKGLALILEALGCEKLPTSRSATEVLKLLAARVTQILAKPVDEILAILPNLVYFLNANGAGVAVSNMLAPIVNLLDALAIENVKLDLADLIKITKDDGTVVKLNLGALTLANIVNFVEELTGLNLVAVENLLVDFCVGKIVNYGSISEMPTFKMVADKADVVTIVLTTALAVINTEGNTDVIGVEIIKNIQDVFNSAPVTYVTPNWDYCWDKEDINYVEGTIGVIESALTYPNDWTKEKSIYLAGHLSSLVDTVVKMVTKNDEASLATIIDEKVNIYTPDLLKTIQQALGDLIGGLDADIQALVNVGFGAADKLLGADVQGLLKYDVSGVKDKETFVAALTGMLMEVEGLVDWLLLGEDYKLFVDDKNNNGKYDDGEDIITLNGAHGYAEGLALLLEALGCEDLPEVYDVEGEIDTEATVSAVLTSLANRIDDVLDNPIDEALDLLPNLIYFLNTNGVAAVIDNLTGAFTALVTKLEGFGLNLDLNALINIPKLMKIEGKGATISLDNLAMKDILQAVSLMLDLDLTVLEGTLNGFALGKVTAYESVSRTDLTFKMGYKDEFDKHDMITVLVTALLLVVETEGNAESLKKLLGENIYNALRDVFAGGNVAYAKPNWDYDQTKYEVVYPNNWTEATAEEVTKFLLSKDFDKLIAGLIEDGKYDSIGALLTAKVDVFTTENLNALVKIINDLLGGIDAGLIEGAGILLDAKLVGENSLATYTAPEGIKTVKAFAKELAKVLTTYAPGVVEWLLLGQDYRFFVNDADGDAGYTYGEDIITISGANGYTEGLALLLEALGVAAPAVIKDAEGNIKTAETVEAVLVALADRIEVILGNPVVEIINLLPNLFYFLNTNGVAAVVDNTLAAVFALLGKLEAFGVKLDINELVNLKSLMGLEDTEATISLDNLAMKDILQAVSLMVGLDLTYIEKVLVGFGLGTVEAYTSVSTQAGTPKKMIYTTDFANYDMVTVLANLVLITIADAKNAEFVKDLAGEEIYAVILDILNLEENEAPVQKMNWKGVPEKVGQIFNALETSPTYKGFEYGPLYTEEMAQYIADNIGEFINNIIYLLGLEINGVNVESLEDLLKNLVGGSLYNSGLVITIRDALAGLATSIEGLEVNGVNVGKTIVTVLATADIADLKAIGKVNVPAFEDNRELFVESLCNVLEPAYGLLTWLLADEDLAFFVDVDKSDFITLPGAEGYRNGIALLLEAIGCKNLPTELNGEGDALVKAILNPLLNRLDVIFANPAEEILAVLTNVIYFINSKGVDVVIKNTLNAVYTVLNAIEPIAEVDLYELVGLDAYVTLSAEELIDMLLSKLEVAGFDFTAISVDLFSELTIGKLTQYTSISAEGAEAYKMVYDAEYADEADMVTAVMRLVITFILTENNREVLINLLKSELGMSADAEKYVTVLLDGFADVVVGKKGEDLRLGMDSVLATIYYIFYGLDTGVDNTVAGKKDLDKLWSEKIKELGYTEEEGKDSVGNLITDIFDILFNDPDEDGNFPVGGGNDVADKEEIAPNGFIAFFQRIAKFFEEIGEFFRNLFSFGK